MAEKFEVGDHVSFKGWERYKRSSRELDALSVLQLVRGQVERVDKKTIIVRWGGNVYKLDAGDFVIENRKGFLAEMYPEEIEKVINESVTETVEDQEVEDEEVGESEENQPTPTAPERNQQTNQPTGNVEQIEFLSKNALKFDPASKIFIGTAYKKIRLLDGTFYQVQEGNVVDAAIVQDAFKLWRLGKVCYDRLNILFRNGQHFGRVEDFLRDIHHSWERWGSWSPGQVAACYKHINKYQDEIKRLQKDDYRSIKNGWGVIEPKDE